jgi:Tol biopolymer transport system component
MKALFLGVLAALVALTALTTLPAAAKVPGQNGRIAFDRYDPATDENVTYTANPDGSDVQRLLPDYLSANPNWSPDGTEVAVVSGLDTQCPPSCAGNTVIVDPDTGDYRVLEPQGLPDVYTYCSLWSPDATRFACEGGNEDDPDANGIYTIRSSDGGGLTRLTNAGGGWDIPLDYSPEGTQIVFGRFDVPGRAPNANSALFVVSVDGGSARRITPWGFADNRGSWSPDGTKIAFEHRGSLFVVHPDGSGLAKVPLAVGSRAFAGDYAWSPDGTRIVFLLTRQVGPQTFEEGIATAKTDGSDVQLVTSSPTFDHQADWGSHPLTP